ncbi:MAG: polyketide cyclase [Actinobacteria bacterium 13_1_20CM_3_71_11]|nr:MAG: polyketide cyclase [Actinobacteria bacterium 13_1_20CM_3_71_11]
MIATTKVIGTSPDRIFAVLTDGWSYASWVVGAAHIRDVDATWPQVGSKVYHRVGPWPLQLDDESTVRAMEPDRLLELAAGVWPLGAALVRLELVPVGPAKTRVTMSEKLTSGIGRVLPEPVQAVLLRPRNAESLRRLDDIAVHREARA